MYIGIDLYSLVAVQPLHKRERKGLDLHQTRVCQKKTKHWPAMKRFRKTHLGFGRVEVPAVLLATAHGCDNGSLFPQGKATAQ